MSQNSPQRDAEVIVFPETPLKNPELSAPWISRIKKDRILRESGDSNAPPMKRGHDLFQAQPKRIKIGDSEESFNGHFSSDDELMPAKQIAPTFSRLRNAVEKNLALPPPVIVLDSPDSSSLKIRTPVKLYDSDPDILEMTPAKPANRSRLKKVTIDLSQYRRPVERPMEKVSLSLSRPDRQVVIASQSLEEPDELDLGDSSEEAEVSDEGCSH